MVQVYLYYIFVNCELFFVGCYPYYDDDPFILDSQPDIYFAGNQPKFETKIIDVNCSKYILEPNCCFNVNSNNFNFVIQCKMVQVISRK